MKRARPLISLSHDHHRALGQSLWLSRATGPDAERTRAGFLAFWREEGEPHFASEERALLPPCRRHGGELAALAERMVDEHAMVRAAVQRLESAPSVAPEALHALGDELRRHVRFEERILFPLIESTLDQDELSSVWLSLRP